MRISIHSPKENQEQIACDYGSRKFKTMVSLLERNELTLREKQFLEGVKEYYFKHSRLTEQQWSILEGVYKEKVWIGKTFISQDLSKRSSSRAG